MRVSGSGTQDVAEMFLSVGVTPPPPVLPGNSTFCLFYPPNLPRPLFYFSASKQAVLGQLWYLEAGGGKGINARLVKGSKASFLPPCLPACPWDLLISPFSHSAPLIPAPPLTNTSPLLSPCPFSFSLDSGPEHLELSPLHPLCLPPSFSLCLPFVSWKSTWITTGKWNQDAQCILREGKVLNWNSIR